MRWNVPELLRGPWRGDLWGGVTAAVVALPLALAVGVLSGAGAVAGLYGAILTGVLAALFGGAPTQITGPTLTTIGVVIAAHAAGGWDYLIFATLFAGAYQVIAGLLRLGRFITYIPQPVVSGFTTGMAAYIFWKQVPAFLAEPWVALVPIVVMLVLPRFTRAVPPSLAGLVAATAAVQFLGADVRLVGEIPRGLPTLHLPTLTWDGVAFGAQAGLELALLAAMESLLTAFILAEMTGTRPALDRELIGQGIGNLVAPLFRGLPGNGAMVRSVVNTRAGGTTRLSGVVHGLTLLLITLYLGWLAALVPVGSLAGVLMVTAVGMVDWPGVKGLVTSPRTDAAVLVATAALTYHGSFVLAVAGGSLLSMVAFGLKLARVPVHRQEVPGAVILTPDGPLFFGIAHRFLAEVEAAAAHRVQVWDLRYVGELDATAAHILRKAKRMTRQQGKAVYLVGLHDQPRTVLQRMGILAEWPDDRILVNLETALSRLTSHPAAAATPTVTAAAVGAAAR